MAGLIKGTPEQIHGVANQFQQESQQGQDMVNRLRQTVNQLAPDWSGATQQQFYQQYEQWQTTMNQFVQMLHNISQNLNSFANDLAEADARAASGMVR